MMNVYIVKIRCEKKFQTIIRLKIVVGLLNGRINFNKRDG